MNIYVNLCHTMHSLLYIEYIFLDEYLLSETKQVPFFNYSNYNYFPINIPVKYCSGQFCTHFIVSCMRRESDLQLIQLESLLLRQASHWEWHDKHSFSGSSAYVPIGQIPTQRLLNEKKRQTLLMRLKKVDYSQFPISQWLLIMTTHCTTGIRVSTRLICSTFDVTL